MSARRAAPGGLAVLALAALSVVACRSPEPRSDRSEPARDEPLLLRHRFEPGDLLRYESVTVERGRSEVTIRMRTGWRVAARRPSGEGELLVTVESYSQSVTPPTELPADVSTMNRDLAGARFRLLVSADGREVEDLGEERLPTLSPASVEALRVTLRSHVLRLPEGPVEQGQRWSVDLQPGADAGPGALTTRSRWRVLSVRPEQRRRPVELVCFSTMQSAPIRVEQGMVTSRTEIRYSYLFDAAAGRLERLTSRGESVVTMVPSAGSPGGEDRTRLEATVRLVAER